MPTNFYMFFIAALIPLLVGFVYYNDKVFGGPWKRVNGFSDADLEGGNMAAIFGEAGSMSGFMLDIGLLP